MPLDTTVHSRAGRVIVVLAGSLDASTAPIFEREVSEAFRPGVKQLLLDLRELSYLSSAGLRQLIFARQQMDDDVRMELMGANERVTQTITLVGFDQSVVFVDDLPA